MESVNSGRTEDLVPKFHVVLSNFRYPVALLEMTHANDPFSSSFLLSVFRQSKHFPCKGCWLPLSPSIRPAYWGHLKSLESLHRPGQGWLFVQQGVCVKPGLKCWLEKPNPEVGAVAFLLQAGGNPRQLCTEEGTDRLLLLERNR